MERSTSRFQCDDQVPSFRRIHSGKEGPMGTIKKELVLPFLTKLIYSRKDGFKGIGDLLGNVDASGT